MTDTSNPDTKQTTGQHLYRLTCRDCKAMFLSPLWEAQCPACQRAMLARREAALQELADLDRELLP